MRKLSDILLPRIRELVRSRDGAVAMIFSLSSIVCVVSAGMAIDMARAYTVQVRLGAALDAAGLAVGSTTGMTDAQLQTRFTNFFNANYPTGALGTPKNVTMTIDHANNQINVSAQATVNTTLMRVVGFNSMTVSSKSQITLQTTGLELALVLDNTGSMLNNNNIAALRNDSTQLVNILYGANTTSNNLKISVVPFVTAVNVGSIAPSLVSSNPHPYSPTDPTKWKGCVTEPNYPADEQETVVAGQRQQYWWASASDNTWTNSNIAISESLCNNSHGPNLGCGTPVTPLTSDKTTLMNALNSMLAWCRSGTIIHVGMAWGWRTISPQSPFSTQGLPYNTPGWKKAMVIETDGANDMYKPSGSAFKSDFTSFGRLDAGNLGTTNSGTATTILNNRITDMCNAIKAKGITIYAITFTGAAAGSRTLFQNCATDPTKYFDAPDQATLQTAFTTIANQLNNLRLSK
ncbi:MAG TPA: TadE/TadG family type IV pilus assembly protein [Candidatus Cybelea sp.]|nr:TadE/TadG family type IV pilus assembly protein [Candidatus Cybelea sp.]